MDIFLLICCVKEEDGFIESGSKGSIFSMHVFGHGVGVVVPFFSKLLAQLKGLEVFFFIMVSSFLLFF